MNSFANPRHLKKLAAGAITLALILPQVAYAVLPPIPPAASSHRLENNGDNPLNVPPATLQLLNARNGGGEGNQTARAKQVLRQRRQQDYLVCQAEARGEQTLGQLAVEPLTASLKDRMNEAIQLEATPNALESATRQTLYSGVTDRLRTDLQPALASMTDRIEANFSTNLRRNLARNNLTLEQAVQDRGRFTGLVRDSLRESFPQSLNEDFVGDAVSSSLDGAFRDSLKDNLTIELNKTARQTIEYYYRPVIFEMVGQTIPTAIQAHIQNLTATIKGTRAGVEGIFKNITQTFAGPPGLGFLGPILGLIEGFASLPEAKRQLEALIANFAAQITAIEEFTKWLAALDTEKLVDDIIEGMALQMTTVITDPKNVNRLVDAIGDAITDPINASIEENIDKIIDAAFVPIAALETAIDTFDDIIVDSVADAIDAQLNLFIGGITGTADRIIDNIGDTVADAIDDSLGRLLYPPASEIDENDPSTWGIARNISAGAISIGDRISGGINNAGFNLYDSIWPRPEFTVVSDDFFDTTLGPYPPNYIRESDFAQAGSIGFALVPDEATLRPGEMHLSDYQTIVNDEPQLVGPEMEALAANGATATEEGAETAVNNAVAAQAPAGSTAGTLGTGFLNGLSGAFGSVVTGGITSVIGGVPYVGPILEQAAKQAIDAAMTAAGAIKPAAPGLAVNETGLLLSISGGIEGNTGQIAKNTGKIAGESAAIREMTERMLTLQIEMCTHLKVIRRIQESIEEKEFYHDAAARKASAQVLFAAQNAFIQNVVLQGRTVPDPGVVGASAEDNKQPAFGLESKLVAERKTEARNVAIAELEESLNATSPFGSLLVGVGEAGGEEPVIDFFDIGVTEEDLNKFYTAPFSLSEAEYDEIKARIEANPLHRQALSAYQYITEREREAEEDVKAALAQGNGVLPSMVCEDWAMRDGRQVGCREYKVLVPAGVTSAQLSAFATYMIDYLKNADEVNDDVLKSGVANFMTQWTNLPAQPETALQSPFNKGDPCTGPVCPDAGWQGGQQAGQQLESAIGPEPEF